MATIKRRGPSWQATVKAPGGRERTKSFAKKVDAERWAVEQGAAIARGAWVDPSAGRVLLKDYAAAWLERRVDLSPRTAELYGWLLERYIAPMLGGTPMAAVAPSQVEAWRAAIGGDHPITAAKSYRLLSTIMRSAARDRIIVESPCQVKGGAVEKAKERPVASVAEVGALVEAMPEHLRIVVLLAAWCQLRRGEVLGLRRRDVDPLHGTISVNVTRTTMMSGAVVEKAPKTDAGRRTVAVPTNIAPALVEHLVRHVGADPDALVVTGEKGGPLLPQVLATAWQRARGTIGRPDLRLHDLRHSGLTWSAATGATVAELMHRAGHASPAAALRYQHATADRDRALADALAELSRGADVRALSAGPREVAQINGN